jgi:2-dehydro-3-deoxyphosphogluconate aldolase/(4S)-4-hydroxy-2-oxoglutarate aldolase
LREVPFIPAGGLDATTAPAFLEAGAAAVGIGSWLTGVGNSDETARRARKLAELCAAVGQS